MKFNLIPDATVILVSGGVYKQAKAYAKDGQLFASHGSGFISLQEHGNTSAKSIVWKETDVPYTVGQFGRLMIKKPSGFQKAA